MSVSLGRALIRNRQKERFAALVRCVLSDNPFYQEKFSHLALGTEDISLGHLERLPFTEKSELVADQEQNPPFGSNLTLPLEEYTRVHQTSGTTGRPLRWLDTAESWLWWLRCWVEIYEAHDIGSGDRIFIPFSFGPFIGFWAAFEAGPMTGALTLPAGGLTSEQRIEKLIEYDATVVVCTPTYGLRLAQVAREMGVDLSASSVRITLHAGESGASLPNVKERIEEAWGARCVDHAGATEVGAWGYGCGERNHMHINEGEFLAEVIDPESGEPAAMGDGETQQGELVLTNLGRSGSPVIRYRTGDFVKLSREPCLCGRPTAWLGGGVLGRIDQMVTVRGINVYPSAIDNIMRAHGAVQEYEAHVRTDREMAELVLRIEAGEGDPEGVATALEEDVHRRLMLRPTVEVVPDGTLPRYELKAKRFRGVERPEGATETG